jgi:Ca2+-binding RTX toxin-like protein
LIVVSRSTGYDENDVAGDPGISLVIFDFEADEITNTHVNEEHTGDERDPDVTVLANGYIAVTWTRPSTNDDIYCRIFDPDGGQVTDEFFIAANGFEEERESAVSAMLGGLFITSWQDSTTDGSGGSISSQITELTRTVVGDAVGNLHVGDDLRESIDGGGGADTLHGGRGADTIDGGNFGDGIFGGDGDDLLQGNINGDSILGGAGDDLIFACTQADPTGSFNGDDIRGEAGADTVVGSSGDDTVYGGEGEDAITGGAGNDFMFGEIGDDRLRGLSGADVLSGSTGSDTINGGVGEDLIYGDSALNSSADADVLNGANGNDIIIGAAGDDRIAGLGRKDTMSGRDGDDTIAGGSDKDRLDGGLGADRLTGGSEKDVFAYGSVGDSAVGAEDRITDCGNHDFIDLSDIDAKAGPAGDQKFTLVDAFSGAQGELVVRFDATGPYAGFTTVRGDVDGDGSADFVIKIDGDVDKFDNFIF